jgi:hypothetical protein
MLDGTHSNKSINLNKELISVANILELFEKYNVPLQFDYLSEDTDYADYWIVEKILTKYKPKVIVYEVNQQPAESCVTVANPGNDVIFWPGTEYHSGSVCAFYCLAKQNDYSVVYCESNAINCFMIRNDIIRDQLNLNVKLLQETLTPTFLQQKPNWKFHKTDKKWFEIKC